MISNSDKHNNDNNKHTEAIPGDPGPRPGHLGGAWHSII